MLQRLGAVQLDTISVLARSHELVAYARLGAIGRTAVEAAYWARPAVAFEYNAHANCVLPMEAWPYFAFRRRYVRARPVTEVSARAVDAVRRRLANEPVTATDLGGARASGGWWNRSESKTAIEALYYRGEVVCTERRAWKRVYDLPERAIPSALLRREPSEEECFRYLVGRAARALGVASRRDIADYFRLTLKAAGSPKDAGRLLDRAIDESGLVPATVEGWDEPAFVDPDVIERAGQPIETRPTLLSPFDSLIWDRGRTRRLFDFTMSLEAYKPKAQRVHGYFAMPLLAGDRLIGRVDPAREGRTLVARSLSLDEPSAANAMVSALRDAARWVGCDTIRIDQTSPRSLARTLRKALS